MQHFLLDKPQARKNLDFFCLVKLDFFTKNCLQGGKMCKRLLYLPQEKAPQGKRGNIARLLQVIAMQCYNFVKNNILYYCKLCYILPPQSLRGILPATSQAMCFFQHQIVVALTTNQKQKSTMRQ